MPLPILSASLQSDSADNNNSNSNINNIETNGKDSNYKGLTVMTNSGPLNITSAQQLIENAICHISIRISRIDHLYTNKSNVNPYLIVQYGQEPIEIQRNTTTITIENSNNNSFTNNNEQEGIYFIQKTKIVNYDHGFPIYNETLQIPLLTNQTKIYFKLMNNAKYRKDNCLGIASFDLSDITYLGDEEKQVITIQKLSYYFSNNQNGNGSAVDNNLGGSMTDRNKNRSNSGGKGIELVTDQSNPLLYLDIGLKFKNENYLQFGDDPSVKDVSQWVSAIQLITKSYNQQLILSKEGNNNLIGNNLILEDDSFLSPKERQKKQSTIEQMVNRCELLKMLRFKLPKNWSTIAKSDKMIFVSPTQLFNEEIITDNINVYYVYDNNVNSIMEDMIKNYQKRNSFKMITNLHKITKQEYWEGYKFQCFYSLYKKVYRITCVGIQTKIGLTYIFQYISNCGHYNEPVFDKILDNFNFLNTYYSKDLSENIYCGYFPLGWRLMKKDNLIHIISPDQSNSKLNCTDQIIFQSFLNNMTLKERMDFIINKIKERKDVEDVEMLLDIQPLDLSKDINNEDHLYQVHTLEQTTIQKPIQGCLEEVIMNVLSTTKDSIEEAYTTTFAIKLLDENSGNLNSSNEGPTKLLTSKVENRKSWSPSTPTGLSFDQQQIFLNDDANLVLDNSIEAKQRVRSKALHSSTSLSYAKSGKHSNYLFQRTVTLKPKGCDFQLHVYYQSSYKMLIHEDVFNKVLMSLKFTP
ncbi:hypothetical protein ABK040_014123 [Willaertia magna]